MKSYSSDGEFFKDVSLRGEIESFEVIDAYRYNNRDPFHRSRFNSKTPLQKQRERTQTHRRGKR